MSIRRKLALGAILALAALVYFFFTHRPTGPVRRPAGTPFDAKIASSGIRDLGVSTPPEPVPGAMEALFARCRAFRYREDEGGDHWQTPAQTESLGSGDCEDKAVWMFARLARAGYRGLRLVIGRYRAVRNRYHVWVTYTDPRGTEYVIDAAAQKKIWKESDFPAGTYRPVYVYDGSGPVRRALRT
ncbi:MAG TPA: hypothetical protein VL404_08025 [Candidatus Eisenbacteria bacterium]|nr:hypothetical protein [Candidatus Eisenbacteria bacterium]